MIKIALSSIATLLSIANAHQYLTFDGYGILEWFYDEKYDEVVFIVTIPNKTYFGLLLGSNSMLATDCLVFLA